MRYHVIVKATLLSVVTILMSSQAHAERFSGGVGFVIGSPKGGFRDNVDREGYGFSIEGMYKPSILPFGIGIDFGYMNYGHDERTEAFSTTIPDVKVRVKNNNNILSGNFVMRYRHEGKWITPYVDALIGLKYLYTDTKITEKDGWGDEEIASSNNFDDVTYGIGGGGGLLIHLVGISRDQLKPDGGNLYLDLRCRYISGGKAEYLKKGSIREEDGKVKYDVYESDTDMLYFHIGVMIGF